MNSVTNLNPSIGEIYSPTQTNSQFNNKLLCTKADQNYTSSSFSAFNPQVSITEQEILSHALIQQVILKSRNKTIYHDVNRIPIDTKLYKIPKEKQIKEFEFDTIPPAHPDYCSTGTHKVKQIHQRLSDQKDLADRLCELAEQNKMKYIQNKKKSQSLDTTNKRISISGLVSYNFNSVRARRSLGSIPKQPQQVQLEARVSETRKKSTSRSQRQNKIIRRKPNPQSLQNIQISKAAVCDFHTQTDKFLRVLRKESQKDSKIYGERLQKLNCVKQFMQKQKADYENSNFIVEAILNSQKKQEKSSKKRKGIETDDDLELSKRRQVLNKKKIMLKHLAFADL